MNYYYDLCLFFNNYPYKFYEWELSDDITEIKKIPLYRVSENTLINIFKYNGSVDNSFLNKIKNRTTYKENGKIKTVMYAAIFTDTKFSLAVMFNENGDIIKRSNILLEDDLNIIEIACSLKKEKVFFSKQEKALVNNVLRQEEKMKQFIRNEIKKAKEDNYNKLVYYYMEWFKEYNYDIKTIYKKMLDKLENETVVNLEKMYNLILQLVG